MKQMFAALVAAALLAAPAVAKTSTHAHTVKVAKAHHAHSMHKTASKKPLMKKHMKKSKKKGM